MKDKLLTPSYALIMAANFLLYFGFWMLVPLLPFYLKEVFGCTETAVGVVLCIYTISALCIRPFSGFLMDTFQRKPLYLLCYFAFTAVFLGYILAGTLTLFVMLRVVHGFAFGGVTVGGNTIVVDIMPSSRRGEGLGYYGLTNNSAMALGPMVGLFMHGAFSFTQIFTTALAVSSVGFVLASLIRTPRKQPTGHAPLSLDRFILINGLPASLALMLLSIPYGATTNYVAIYAREIGLTAPTGLFFTFMAAGMGISRIFAGKYVDRGYVTQCISHGFWLVIAAFFLLSMCRAIIGFSTQWCTAAFYLVALLLGTGFGIMFPAYNTLYVNLAPNNKRATATSTYLTAWDVGIGLGMVGGGAIAELSAYDKVYLIGTVLCIVSMFYFRMKVTPHYNLNKVR
ncbi:MAG: MFS transporter [Bacteroidaceae bacterium]|nr:MFS transporter [Bacteroidaceae bacterium]